MYKVVFVFTVATVIISVHAWLELSVVTIHHSPNGPNNIALRVLCNMYTLPFFILLYFKFTQNQLVSHAIEH